MEEKTHTHKWSNWIPYDRNTHYRYCTVWGCAEQELRKFA